MPAEGPFEHRVELLGPAPLLHHFLERTHLPEILRRHLPEPISPGTLLLLHDLLQAREPLFGPSQRERGPALHEE